MPKNKQLTPEIDNKQDTIHSLSQLILENKPNLKTLEILKQQLELVQINDETNTSYLIDEVEERIDTHQQPLLDKAEINGDEKLIISPAGVEFLEPIVTSSSEDVYAFKDGMNTATIAASMARLSRRGDDLRITLLEEFSDLNQTRDKNLLKRVITAYGDDSVQQLTGQHFVIENASNLLTKKIEWGRLASYLEQSTRYIYFDVRDNQGRYKYVIPPELIKHQYALQQYTQSMDNIFENYKSLVHQLTAHVRESDSTLMETKSRQEHIAWRNATRAQACDAARGLLPVATKSTVGVFASAQATENMIMRLRGDKLLEAQQTGDAILEATRQNIGVFLERADIPERGGAYSAYMSYIKGNLRNLAVDHNLRSEEQSRNKISAQLVNYNYPNELDLVADMLYEHSHKPLAEIQKYVTTLNKEDKVHIFKTYIGERLNRRHKPGRALEKIHYDWDIVSDYGIFRDLQRHRMVEDLTWQDLTPHIGYETPELIQQAQLTDLWNQTFEISTALYEYITTTMDEDIAQYATLLGHLMRWKISYNAREAFHIHELRTSPQGHPNYRRLVNMMHQKISHINPLLAESMIFVNQDEDPVLTRLAAERYQQFKLDKLT